MQVQHTTGHGIASGVIATHDQQHQVAHVGQWVVHHIGGLGITLQHADQIERLPVIGFMLVPELGKALQHFDHDHTTLVDAKSTACRNASIRGRGIRPVGQQMPLLLGKIKKCGQHLGGQVDRHPVYPVEGLTHGQSIQGFPGTLTNQQFKLPQVAGRHYSLHSTALVVVQRRIGGNEHLHRHVGLGVEDGNGRLRGKRLPILLNLNNVLIAGD